MLQAFVITLREGLEAFLIIGISLAYLRKSGRRELIPAVHWGIGLSVLMISREGMETALLMGTLLTQVQATTVVGGAIAGTISAAGVAMLWSRYGHRVNLGLFFQVTAIFLLVFVGQLLIYGFHELTEANLFPNSEALHLATEPYGPDGIYGQYLTYLLVAMPLSWLLLSMATGGNRAPQARPAAPGRAA